MTITSPVRPTELECQATIVAAATHCGWLVHAERTSRTQSGRWATAVQGHTGFPDLVLVHPARRQLLIVELKRKPNKVEPAQHRWHDALAACGLPVHIWWVPEDLADCLRIITGGAA